MSVNQMREILMKQYKGAYKWRNKVKHWPDAQVIAVYYKMLDRKQLVV